MQPFKIQHTQDYQVTMIRKTTTIIKETYTFEASSYETARVMFLLWWWSDQPMFVKNSTETIEEESFECHCDFLNKLDKDAIKNNIKENKQELSEGEREIVENLMRERRYFNI